MGGDIGSKMGDYGERAAEESDELRARGLSPNRAGEQALRIKKLEARARIAEQREAELVECLRAAIDYIDASPCDPDITAEQRAAHLRLWELSPRDILAKQKS